jgi:N-acetylglutamate synthase-like GNAT family acetyltransferase
LKSSSDISIRAAEPADLQGLSDFLAPFVADGKILRRNLSELESLIGQYTIAVKENRIVGSVVLEVYSPKLGEIRSLAVSSDYQGQGIGKLLVNACLEQAREKGVFEVMAITSQDSFFQSCGFDYTLPGEKKALFYLTRPSM